MNWRHAILGLAVFAAVLAGAIVRAPRRLATIHCADGSTLIIQEATFGVMHQAFSEPHWLPRMRNSSQMERTWELLCDCFRPPAKRLRQVDGLRWKSEVPAAAFWGGWHPSPTYTGEHPHVFRYVLVDDSGLALGRLDKKMRLGTSWAWGLIATTTNLPPSSPMHIQVFDDGVRVETKPIAEFACPKKRS